MKEQITNYEQKSRHCGRAVSIVELLDPQSPANLQGIPHQVRNDGVVGNNETKKRKAESLKSLAYGHRPTNHSNQKNQTNHSSDKKGKIL